MYKGIARPQRGKSSADTLVGADVFSGWGIRTFDSGEARYNPLSYHNGSVWPHDNALIASGLTRYGFKNLAGKNLPALPGVSPLMEMTRLPDLLFRPERPPWEGPALFPSCLSCPSR